MSTLSTITLFETKLVEKQKELERIVELKDAKTLSQMVALDEFRRVCKAIGDPEPRLRKSIHNLKVKIQLLKVTIELENISSVSDDDVIQSSCLCALEHLTNLSTMV